MNNHRGFSLLLRQSIYLALPSGRLRRVVLLLLVIVGSALVWFAILISLRCAIGVQESIVPPPLAWIVKVPSGLPDPRSHQTRSAWGVRSDIQLTAEWTRDPAGAIVRIVDYSICRTRVGWPVSALEMTELDHCVTFHPNTPAHRVVCRTEVEGGIVTNLRGTRLSVPYQPLWSGLAINVVIITTMLVIVVLGVSAIRVIHRRRNGQCVYCKYEVRELDKCPECGLRAS